MPDRQILTESRPLAEAADSGGLAAIQLITPGWGSTGYYSAGVLAEAANARVFPAGTHMYLDHPMADGSGVDEGGNRSVRDLAAVLVEDARTDGDGGLVASARVFAPWRPVLSEVKDAIGVSVRARGTGELGEAEGRRGLLITSIDEALSADFVVAAGRGGRILELAESARVAAASDTELLEANVNDTREALQTEVGETYGNSDECHYVWVRDFDPDAGVVHFEVNRRGDCSIYSQPYTQAADGTCELQGEAVEVTAQTVYVPVTAPDPDAQLGESAAAGTTTPTDAAEGAAASTTPIQEDHMTDTPGAGATPTTPRQVLEAGQAALRRQVAELQARDRARTIISESLADAWLTNSTVARLSAELLEGLPIVEDQLDEAALRDRIVAKRDIAETEAAEMLQAAGVGTPRGLGDGGSPAGIGGDQAGFDAEFGAAMRDLGLSESAAKIAVKGR
jgi:hypothetical protein